MFPRRTRSARNTTTLQTCLLLASLMMITSCSHQPDQYEKYVTWEGIGPDKWASVWLISRHINPAADIEFIPVNEHPTEGIAFDIPGATYQRSSTQTTFEELLNGHQVTDPSVQIVARIIRDIEIDAWRKQQSVASPYVEQEFRGLQFHYGRENVPPACYLDLFDKLYKYIATTENNIDIPQLEQQLAHQPQCAQQVAFFSSDTPKKFVPEWHAKNVLQQIDSGKNVIFIDTRETDEYHEGHIPGAINIKLRDLGRELPASVLNADLVIPYCVKDFRGFEVAKQLKRQGVENVGLLNPYGIAGWRSAGLPVAGNNALPENEAMSKLHNCAANVEECLKDV